MIQKPKGTVDLLDKEARKYLFLNNYVNELMLLYNYDFIKVPTFEVSELYKRGVGESTDIVNKETYDFVDKGERNMTLRPEFTAGVVRSYIENKEYASNKLKKYYYFGSCFRYERPQSGRLREFTQFGVEVIGVKSAVVDAEVINMAYKFISGLGIDGIKVKINTLGDAESRSKYKEVLKEYLEEDKDNLCDICKERLERNPLRILDCKYDGERDYIKNAPRTLEYLNEESANYFEEVKKCLEVLGIPYVLDSSLVRGLDYYSHTVFEIVLEDDSLGPASTLCGGGRYDKLVNLLGGPDVAAVGFAMGIERIMGMLSDSFDKKVDVYVMNLTKMHVLPLVNEIRDNGYIVETDYSGKNMKGQWKIVDEVNPDVVLIVGEDEVNGGVITVKDNATKEQVTVKREQIVEHLDMYY